MSPVSDGPYSGKKNLSFKTPMPRSDLCDYSDGYIVVKKTIIIASITNAKRRNKKLTFKNNAPCVDKLKGVSFGYSLCGFINANS